MTKQYYEMTEGFVSMGIAVGFYADVLSLFNLPGFFLAWLIGSPFLFAGAYQLHKWDKWYTDTYGKSKNNLLSS